jgi:hypothetical protein
MKDLSMVENLTKVEDFFLYDDEFLSLDAIKSIQTEIIYNQSFHVNPFEWEEKPVDPHHIFGDMFQDFPFLTSGTNSTEPEGPVFEIGKYILHQLSLKNSLAPMSIFRAKSNLTTITTETKPSWPHIDGQDNHLVFIYYVNDSDGDTVIYDQKYTGKEYDQSELTVFKKITPKAGAAVIFDGSRYHTNYSNQKNNFRFIINMNLKPMGEQ